VPVPRKLPIILNKNEVTRLIEAAATSPKYQAALSVAYGAGLRIGEIVALKMSDIDRKRMTLPVQSVAFLRNWKRLLRFVLFLPKLNDR